MNFEFIKHDQCSQKQINEICYLKKQHWNYSIQSQKKWIEENISNNDFHLFLRNNEGLVGYLSLVEVTLTNADEFIVMLGIGSVSVDKKFLGQSYGVLLMKLVDFYLQKNKKQGVLLCSDELIGFYEKSGWSLFNGNLFCEEKKFHQRTFFSENKNWKEVNISKLF